LFDFSSAVPVSDPLPSANFHHQRQSTVQKVAAIQLHLCRTQPQHQYLASSLPSLGSCFVIVDLRQTHLHLAFTDSLSLAHHAINHRSIHPPHDVASEVARATSFISRTLDFQGLVFCGEEEECLVKGLIYSYLNMRLFLF
jgi:hypothetical protein